MMYNCFSLMVARAAWSADVFFNLLHVIKEVKPCSSVQLLAVLFYIVCDL